MSIQALIFDVDGTLAETETTHRVAFNNAFAQCGVDWTWSHEVYRDLLKVTGGKERMRHYAETRGLSSVEIPNDLIVRIHTRKNELYSQMARRGDIELRPGVERLVRDALARGLQLALCTTTSRTNVYALIAAKFGPEGFGLFETIICGEDVRSKKPAPDAYLRVMEELHVPASDCLAFEDLRNGLMAALAADLSVIVTPSFYTAHEAFEGAAQILPDLAHFDLSRFAANSSAGRK